MPKLDLFPYDGRIPKRDKLKRAVDNLLDDGAEAVVALTDVYTGRHEFEDAEDAKTQMRDWAGNNRRFHAHAAQYEFEAWLLPFWPEIQRLSGSNRTCPPGQPERVNHMKPPSRWISEAFQAGGKREYNKPRETQRILEGKDLTVAAEACPQLKALLNTILKVCGGTPIP